MIKKLDKTKVAQYFNYFIKISLILAFIVAIFFPPEVLVGKGMGARAPLFLASAILVPIIFYKRDGLKLSEDKGYPHIADGLLATPFLLDTLGNLFGFYDSFQSTDDVLHFVNWIFLVMAFQAFRYKRVNNNKEAVLIGAGFGAMAIIGWEAFEWFISDEGPFASNVPDALSLTYGDTVGDLVISFSGGLLGSLIARYWFGPGK